MIVKQWYTNEKKKLLKYKLIKERIKINYWPNVKINVKSDSKNIK